jgi:hypothetical protein
MLGFASLTPTYAGHVYIHLQAHLIKKDPHYFIFFRVSARKACIG